jgi:hypothetical protein
MDNIQSIEEQMSALMRQQKNIPAEDSVAPKEQQFIASEWFASLQVPSKPHFFVQVEDEDSYAVFCFRELSWVEKNDIECASFRKTVDDEKFYSEEHEKRNVLAAAIHFVADLKKQHVLYNNKGHILNFLDHAITEKAYEQYKSYTILTSKEANALYSTAIKYFSGNSGDIPVPSIVLEVDAICKGMVSMSREEFKNLSYMEYERYQLIVMARADALNLSKVINKPIENELRVNQSIVIPEGLYPPGIDPKIHGYGLLG